jgi:hypothetical protein
MTVAKGVQDVGCDRDVTEPVGEDIFVWKGE